MRTDTQPSADAASASPPAMVDPWELARVGGCWLGNVPPQRLPRVAGAVERLAGPAKLALRFALDAEGRCRIAGTARAPADVACERCLRTVRLEIVAHINVLAVCSEAAAEQVMPEHDAYVLTGSETPVEALVEDDLLLSLPNRVCDGRETCPHTPAMAFPPAAATVAASHPFAALAGLRDAQPSPREQSKQTSG